jgi:short-subunit dehydrogenase
LSVPIHGVVHGTHAAYPRMLRQGFGHIVNTASMAGLSASPQNAPYGATKAAIVSLSRSLRIEAAGCGVRVSVLCPGFVRTPVYENGGRYGRDMPAAVREIMREQNERMRPMDPDRFAERALAAVRRNRSIVILPGFWRILDWLDRLSPWLVDALAVVGMQKLRARLAKAPTA